MEHRVIKTESEYDNALFEIERLVDVDPDPGSDEGEKLDLLALLVEDYERKNFPINLPDPLDAIKFCMDQRGLSQKDLVPYFGSRSKVSEVLAGKRPLTLTMMKALHEGLKIPAEVFLRERSATLPRVPDFEWTRYPIREMVKREWIADVREKSESYAKAVVQDFFAPLHERGEKIALYRGSYHLRSKHKVDEYALCAWRARILKRALSESNLGEYDSSIMTMEVMREIARLSWFDKGPLLAQEFLRKNGILLVVEGHLPKTYVDGAAFFGSGRNPIIALTLRYDRIDNYWFSLMHEIAHVWKHLSEEKSAFFDDLEISGSADSVEVEADEVASEALIPGDVWVDSKAHHLPSATAIAELSKELRIHPGIIAGKIRKERNNYKIFKTLVGHGEVRKLFGMTS